MEFADDEADRLNAYLDAQTRGRPDNPDGLDPELLAIYEHMKTLNARSASDPALKANLWRTMMTSVQPAAPLDARAIPGSREAPAAWHPHVEAPKARPWRRPRLALNALATAALIVAAVFGAYRFNRPTNEPTFNAAQIAAPETPAPIVPLGACLGALGAIFEYPHASLYANSSQLQSINETATNVDHAQLQGWTIGAGQSARLSAIHSSGYAGLAVDFVLSGFYSASFDGPAWLAHAGELSLGVGRRGIVPAGQIVELSQGDAVAFNYSDGMTLHNASSANPLIFKRVLFTSAAATETPPTGQGFAATVNQSSVLPKSLGDMVGAGDGVMNLIPQVVSSSDSTPHAVCDEPEKVQVLTSLEGPPPTPPSATSKGSSRTNGFSLWIYPNQG